MALINCKECGEKISSKAEKCPLCGIKIKSKGLSLGTALVVLFVGYIAYQCTSASEEQAQEKYTAQEAIKKLSFKYDGIKSGLGSIMMVDARITNNGERDVKDFTIECLHVTNSGTKIDSNKRVLYEVVKAGETRNFKEFNMGFIHSQAKSTSCTITGLTII